ncbi:MAG TPA: hypothetical protein VF884_11775 [Nitrososphaeraceae archaeon]
MQVITVITIIAFISAVLISYAITAYRTTSKVIPSFYASSISDSKGDAKLVPVYKSQIIPEIKDYHDILAASVNKITDNKLILSLDLAGDPNMNEKYETVYLWVINYTNPSTEKTQYYTVIIPNFAEDSNFGIKGWNFAIFDNVAQSYVLPLSKLSSMPKNKVEVAFDPILIGNPASFNYMVSVMIRVNSTYLHKPPDYLVDSAPNNNLFWLKWFA